MQSEDYLGMTWRTLLLALFGAAVTMIGEAIFVFVMRLLGHHTIFTTVWGLFMFVLFMSFLPLQPSGSRISSVPVSLLGRIILVVECTALVLFAIFLSSEFIAFRRITVGIDLAFLPIGYFLLMSAMLMANFSRLRSEMRIARSKDH